MFLKFTRNGSGNCILSKASTVSNAFVNSNYCTVAGRMRTGSNHSNAVCNKPESSISHHEEHYLSVRYYWAATPAFLHTSVKIAIFAGKKNTRLV